MKKNYFAYARCGTSIAEVIVAIALLGTATVGLGRFAGLTRQGLQQRELSTRLSAELLNARERIGSWPLDRVTVEQIEQIPFSAALSQDSAADLTQRRWRASVEPISEPLSALRVTLHLQYTLHGHLAEPQAITFWIVR